ncbi:MAG: GFA family protein [Paracoccus sp. (in: a-proteobacteria)]|uniref:GFA family protein n=1 Tax=Paracoccus sp. TaxID=267 RepID=UPI0026DF2817|nr:GFA family protein [Paracoccus sp. (in: a-proteobacteria)]MDO5621690.1 GFA family protein [Paracoccus sp. (in: a-proteobacteria)]
MQHSLTHEGGCLCGAVRFRFDGRVTDPAACHCKQCRRWSGHVWAAFPVDDAVLTITGDVRWFRSSPQAQRGFCPVCGSSLFWRRDGAGQTDLALGALDDPTGLRLERHIHTADKGDYYDISDGLPQDAQE